MNTDKKRKYLKPILDSRKIELGVYGDYNGEDGGGDIQPLLPPGKKSFDGKNTL